MSIHNSHQFRTGLDALKYAYTVWESLDSPISLSCSLLLKYGEHEQLVRKSIDPGSYIDAHDFFVDYQSVKLLSKYPFLETGIDTKQVAREKFHEAEESCRQTNARFRKYSLVPIPQERVERVLFRARQKIASILGDVPSLERLDFSFGPGAAYGVRGDTSVFNKVASALECTYAFADSLPEFLAEFPGWIRPDTTLDVRLVEGSQLTFVPKDAKTDRPICIEPLLNGLYQKGFGTYIRNRLKRHGVDLTDQTVNQNLAMAAFDSGLATVDFSSASDTIAYGLVLDLLPFDWFQALDIARSPRYEEDGAWRSFQKFTSMGNAYTFELESLIFYCIAYACLEDMDIQPSTGANLSVYGDDVIIPQVCFDLFSEVSSWCGFTINKEKSFFRGSFFESCGQDYFEGTNVRPLLLKKDIDDLPDAFYAINTVARISQRVPRGPRRLAIRRRLRGAHARLVDKIPRRFRVLGPEGFGDSHIIANFDESRPRRHPVFDGWTFTGFTRRPIRVKISECSSGYALYSTRVQSSPPPRVYDGSEIPLPPDNGSGYAVRGKTRIERVKGFCFFEQWPCMHIVDGWYDCMVDEGRHRTWEGSRQL